MLADEIAYIKKLEKISLPEFVVSKLKLRNVYNVRWSIKLQMRTWPHTFGALTTVCGFRSFRSTLVRNIINGINFQPCDDGGIEKKTPASIAITANRFRWLKVDNSGGGGGGGCVLAIKPKLDCSTDARRTILYYVHYRVASFAAAAAAAPAQYAPRPFSDRIAKPIKTDLPPPDPARGELGTGAG